MQVEVDPLSWAFLQPTPKYTKSCISTVFFFDYLFLEPNACNSALISINLLPIAHSVLKKTAVLQAFP
jgi:hypothetical protein